MILIISQNYSEHTTNLVIDWLDYKKIPFERLNGIDFYKNAEIQINSSSSQIEIKNISWNDIGAVWFRRWTAHQNAKDLMLNDKKKPELNYIFRQFNELLRSEYKTLARFFFDWIPKKISFDKIFDDEINKLNVLKKAAEFGLQIPSTEILTKKHNKNSPTITKPISNSPSIRIEQKSYVAYTSIFKKCPNFCNQFAPSLFQSLVKKKYEIRSFFLKGRFYSMAIFSQCDSQTMIDFRKYNFKEPNRTVPFLLPNKIQTNLIKLANFFELDSCSFDLIKTEDNKYIFLEVNPGGQFGMVSYPCNYFLEEKVANELISLNNKNIGK